METVYLPVEPVDWGTISKGLKGDANPKLDFVYSLPVVPEHGVELRFKVLDAGNAIPQIAVFSNEAMAGLIQITGLNNGGSPPGHTWKETYRLYIPKELLQEGSNKLRLEVDRGLYADETASGYTGDSFLWFQWDYVALKALDSPAAEPLHGRYVHLGSTIAAGTFDYNEDALRHLAPMAKWMGVAYSGNWMRASLWSDTRSVWEAGARNYLTGLRNLNLEPMVNIIGANWKNNANLAQGIIDPGLRTYYQNFVNDFGDLYQYVETNNEPGLFGWHQQAVLATHQMMIEERQTNTQPYLKIVAPGWAYWPYNGTPDGWERDAEMRRPIEELSDITNGHSYGGTGVQPIPGGSLYENLRVYGEAEEGFGKPMAMSETGANDNHSDNTKYGTYAYRFAAAFDREMRANIGYVDHIMQHAAFFNDGTDFGLFKTDINWKTHRYEDTQAVPAKSGEGGETRLKTFRRLAAAYATHGRPLVYEVLNAATLSGKKAYFRAVDTSALGTSVIGASSDKLLLNFVNFEKEALTMTVRVTLPEAGTYAGERFGAGNTYAEAHSWVQFTASPELEITVDLGPGETIQYMLDRPAGSSPAAPSGVYAEAPAYNAVRVNWQADAGGLAAEYRVYRSDLSEPLMTVPGLLTSFTDYSVDAETAYTYTVQAVDDSGRVSGQSAAATVTTPVMPVTPSVPGDPTKFEAEAANFAAPLVIANRSGASGGKMVEQTHRGPISVLGYNAGAGGEYTLTIAYASAQESKKNLLVNGIRQATLTLPSTGGWGVNAIQERKFSLVLQPGYNNISLNAAGNGANLDYFRLEEGAYVPIPVWYEVEHDHSYIDYTGFAAAPNGASMITDTAGAAAAFSFNGSGIRWRSDIRSDMGSAEVYVDGALVQTVHLPQAGLEGEDRVVFELTGLQPGLHRIEIKAQSGRVMVHGFEFLGLDPQPPQPLADLIVKEIGWTVYGPDGEPTGSEHPQPGDSLIFTAKVANVGLRPTPLNQTTGLGQITGGVFTVNGGTVSWTDTYNTVLQPGEEAVLTANSSAQGTPKWMVPGYGSYEIGFYVNDISRYPEMSRENNRLAVNLSIEP